MSQEIKAIVSITIDHSFFTLENIIDIESVEKLYEVSGNYDAVAILVTSMDKLNETIDKIKHIKGVAATNTSLVLNEVIKE